MTKSKLILISFSGADSKGVTLTLRTGLLAECCSDEQVILAEMTLDIFSLEAQHYTTIFRPAGDVTRS